MVKKDQTFLVPPVRSSIARKDTEYLFGSRMRRRNRRRRVVPIVIWVVAILWSVMFFGGIRFVHVDGQSMEPTYQDGDWQIAYRATNNAINREGYPACVVSLPNGRTLIKRLIGRPGDVVSLAEGDTYVNGQLVMSRTTQCWDNMEFHLGENEYLVLGDNRANSADCRYFGPIGLENFKFVVFNSGL